MKLSMYDMFTKPKPSDALTVKKLPLGPTEGGNRFLIVNSSHYRVPCTYVYLVSLIERLTTNSIFLIFLIFQEFHRKNERFVWCGYSSGPLYTYTTYNVLHSCYSSLLAVPDTGESL